MKAYRNIGGSVVEITVDVDLNGRPILPPDTTVDARPAAQPGHYVTVVGNSWVQIPSPVAVRSLEQVRQEALVRFNRYREWLLAQPVEHEGVLFDGDATARERLTQSVAVANEGGQVPPAWVTHDNASYPLPDATTLKALMLAVITEFGVRFTTANHYRDLILAADSIEDIEDIEIPAIPTLF